MEESESSGYEGGSRDEFEDDEGSYETEEEQRYNTEGNTATEEKLDDDFDEADENANRAAESDTQT